MVHAEAATRAAGARAVPRAAAPLPGVPVLLKDNLCSTDYPDHLRPRVLAGYRAPYDATVVPAGGPQARW